MATARHMANGKDTTMGNGRVMQERHIPRSADSSGPSYSQLFGAHHAQSSATAQPSPRSERRAPIPVALQQPD